MIFTVLWLMNWKQNAARGMAAKSRDYNHLAPLNRGKCEAIGGKRLDIYPKPNSANRQRSLVRCVRQRRGRLAAHNRRRLVDQLVILERRHHE